MEQANNDSARVQSSAFERLTVAPGVRPASAEKASIRTFLLAFSAFLDL